MIDPHCVTVLRVADDWLEALTALAPGTGAAATAASAGHALDLWKAASDAALSEHPSVLVSLVPAICIYVESNVGYDLAGVGCVPAGCIE